MTAKVDVTKMEMDTTIVSEAIEPTAGYLIGRWWAKCEKARKRRDELNAKREAGEHLNWEEALEVERFWSECRNFWWGVKALNRVSIACEEAIHFSLAMGSVMRDTADYIEEHLGIDPMKEWNE